MVYIDRAAYREEIKLKLTGGLLELELSDETIDQLLNAAMREIQRYICTTKLITIPFKSCIDMKPYKVNSVAHVYRTEGYVSTDDSGQATIDPMQVQQWQMLSGAGNLYNFQDYVSNYLSWNTLLQVRNTTSTDLSFRYDKSDELLYINIASGIPTAVTVEYIPRYDDISEITSDYWIDVLVRLSVALAKVATGRIRSKYSQSNALWRLDGEALLSEGNAELSELRQQLQHDTQLVYPCD